MGSGYGWYIWQVDIYRWSPREKKQSIKTLTDVVIRCHFQSRSNNTELLSNWLDSQAVYDVTFKWVFTLIYSFEMRKRKCPRISVKSPWLPATVTVFLELFHYLLPPSMEQLQGGFDCIFRGCLAVLWELITTEQFDSVQLSQVKAVKWENYACKFHPLYHSSTSHWKFRYISHPAWFSG